jgi:hypothetical protein
MFIQMPPVYRRFFTGATTSATLKRFARSFPSVLSMSTATGSPTNENNHRHLVRPSADGRTFDLKLVMEEPELVKAHLRARCASEEVVCMVDSLAELGGQRAQYIVEGDGARATRKSLSAEIGKLMQKGAGDGEVCCCSLGKELSPLSFSDVQSSAAAAAVPFCCCCCRSHCTHPL